MAIIAGQTAAGTTKTVLVDDDGKVHTVSGAVSSSTGLEIGSVTTVPTNTITTVLNFTNASTALNCNMIYATGTANAEWFVYINDVLKISQRTTAADIKLQIPMNGFILNNTDNIKVKVKHYRPATQDFDCSLGYTR